MYRVYSNSHPELRILTLKELIIFNTDMGIRGIPDDENLVVSWTPLYNISFNIIDESLFKEALEHLYNIYEKHNYHSHYKSRYYMLYKYIINDYRKEKLKKILNV